MPVYTESETTYSITLTGLTEHDLVQILKDHKAQDLTMKEIRQEVTRVLNVMSERASQTKAVKMIDVGGKVECPMCRKGFEPKGLGVHLHRTHHIKNPGKWLSEQASRVKFVMAPPPLQLGSGELIPCPICGKTQGNKYGKSWTTQAQVRKHMFRQHKAAWQERYGQQAAVA